MTKKQIFNFFIIPGLFIQLIGAYFYFVALEGTQIAQIIYTLTKILIITWPIYWVIKKEKLKSPQNHKSSILWGIISGLAISLAMVILFNTFFEYFFQFSDEIKTKVENLGIKNSFLVFALFVSIIHSGIEEYYWRWFIFKGLQTKLKTNTAALISSIAFGGHHFIILSQFFNFWITFVFGLAVMVGGYIWCTIYHKTNSLLGSWVSHLFVDLAIMAVVYTLIF